MTTITVKITECKEDGGNISSINGWIAMDGENLERNNGKTWSEWDRKPMTEDEKLALPKAFTAFRANGCKPGEYTVEV